MRMWMVDPKILCQKHLCGNHVETHMLLGHLKLKRRVDGYIKNNLFEPLYLKQNHDELAKEMEARGYNHNGPLEYDESEILSYLPDYYLNHKIDKELALAELLNRCPECRKRYFDLGYEINIDVYVQEVKADDSNVVKDNDPNILVNDLVI